MLVAAAVRLYTCTWVTKSVGGSSLLIFFTYYTDHPLQEDQKLQPRGSPSFRSDTLIVMSAQSPTSLATLSYVSETTIMNSGYPMLIGNCG
jgi:hypothetical protein